MYLINYGTRNQFNYAMMLCTGNVVFTTAVTFMTTALIIEIMCENFNINSEWFLCNVLRGWNELELVLTLLLLVIQYYNNISLHFNQFLDCYCADLRAN